MKNEILTIVANIHAKPEHVERVKSELIKLIAPTRAEEGCLNYDLHQDNVNENHFMFYENWASRALWQKHMQSEHILELQKIIDDIVEATVINEMMPIG
ncbi:putative quinol monooxygenase [Maribacter sp. 2210JD10-5]|uniref:putative quinol monooxygenase n=1 Tax=Maribacter sp. 2210JD10-5 TaxID=3386272 RepID=UPI0039BCE581